MKILIHKYWMPSEKEYTDIQLEVLQLADKIIEFRDEKFPPCYQEIVDRVEKLLLMVYPPY